MPLLWLILIVLAIAVAGYVAARSRVMAAAGSGWIAAGALVVCEDSAEIALPSGFGRLDARRYGDTWVTLGRCS